MRSRSVGVPPAFEELRNRGQDAHAGGVSVILQRQVECRRLCVIALQAPSLRTPESPSDSHEPAGHYSVPIMIPDGPKWHRLEILQQGKARVKLPCCSNVRKVSVEAGQAIVP